MTARPEYFEYARAWARSHYLVPDEIASDYGAWCVAEGLDPSDASWLRFVSSFPASIKLPGDLCARCGQSAGYLVIDDTGVLSRLCTPCIAWIAIHGPLAIVDADEFYPQ